MKSTHVKCGFSLGLIVSLVLLMCFIAHAVREARAATPEIRAVWTSPQVQFDVDPVKGGAGVREFVKKIAGANFNVILVEVRSEYIAALTDETYRKSVPVAKWDALGELVKASQANGLQVHLWYSFTAYKSPRSPEFNPVHGGHPAWASVGADELKAERAAGKQSPKRMQNLCPLHQEGREWELKLIEQLLKRYPMLSGIHIEEPGYDGSGVCVCDLCLKLYKDIYGFTGTPDVSGPQAADLKCLGTTEFMRELRKRTKARNRHLILSTNGAYSWQSDRRSGRDWKRWAEFNWLDFYVPQLYTSDLNKFREYVRTTISALGKDFPVAAGIAAKWGKKGQNSAETILKEIEIARQEGAKGIVIFRAEFLTDAYLAALKSAPFKDPAPLPRLGE